MMKQVAYCSGGTKVNERTIYYCEDKKTGKSVWVELDPTIYNDNYQPYYWGGYEKKVYQDYECESGNYQRVLIHRRYGNEWFVDEEFFEEVQDED